MQLQLQLQLCLAMSLPVCGSRHVRVCGGETSRVPFWDSKGDVGIIFFALQVCSLLVLFFLYPSYHVLLRPQDFPFPPSIVQTESDLFQYPHSEPAVPFTFLRDIRIK